MQQLHKEKLKPRVLKQRKETRKQKKETEKTTPTKNPAIPKHHRMIEKVVITRCSVKKVY